MNQKNIVLQGKKVLVLGMGISGRSAAEFLLAHGAAVHGVDRDAQLLDSHPEILPLKSKGLITSLESNIHSLNSYDLVILSPGIPSTHPLIQEASKAGLPIMGEIELGCQTAKNPMIGITGSNGKTTVTLLVTHILKHAGLDARALGNVGVPLTRELLNIHEQSPIVLELSSFQLETLDQRCLDFGMILNITPNHLDRYQTMEPYVKAKCRMQKTLKNEHALFMHENVWRDYGHLCSHHKPRLYGFQPESYIYSDLSAVFRNGEKAFDLPPSLKGKKSHNLENLLAAYAICSEKNVSSEVFLQAWESFKKPPHRIEFFKEHQGVRYFDDSKGTNLEAVMCAVQSLDGPIILIAGGVDKGSPYTPWLQVFKNKVKLICAIGEAAAKIHHQIDPQIPVMIFRSLEEAVLQAKQFAQKGDNVLLSPGCASYDMFKNYEHRGQEFKRIVLANSH